MKTIKTLLRENDLKSETDYYKLIIEHYYKGNHLKCSELFQDLKKKQKEFFICNYLNPEAFKKMIHFFVKELLT